MNCNEYFLLNIMIRRINKQYIKPINKLLKEVFQDDYKIDVNLGFVYEINDKIVGVIIYSYYYRDRIRYCYIDSLAVSKLHQNKGIGTVLLNKVINVTQSNIRLSVDIKTPKYKDVIKYYENKKFKQCGFNKVNNIIMEFSRG